MAAALHTKKPSYSFEIYSEGICQASVCSDAPVKEVKKFMAAQSVLGANDLSWKLSKDKEFKRPPGTPHPCPCSEKPGFTHYLFKC